MSFFIFLLMSLSLGCRLRETVTVQYRSTVKLILGTSIYHTEQILNFHL
jgi:hypothetical protein